MNFAQNSGPGIPGTKPKPKKKNISDDWPDWVKRALGQTPLVDDVKKDDEGGWSSQYGKQAKIVVV